MSVSLSGHLPAGDGNGLQAIVSALARDPKGLHVAITILDAKKIVTDADSGDVIPVVRIRRIEVVTDPEDMRVAERLMRRALDRRTGREALPYDLEAEIAAAFADADEVEQEKEFPEDAASLDDLEDGPD